MPTPSDNKLGVYLRDCRSRLDPATFGFPLGRRRTTGLRREEVAGRANISPTWYTWLEQGRGGAPSPTVLDRIATGLMLTGPEREHLFMLGLGRLPEPQYTPISSITPRLQRVLDAFKTSPAIIKTATWDIVGWNEAATLILTDYDALLPHDRNALRMLFLGTGIISHQSKWEEFARFVVGAFRADAARAGASHEIDSLINELSAASPEFKKLWEDNDVVSSIDGLKSIHHPALGLLEMEFSAFAVDGRTDLSMFVFNPANGDTSQRLQAYIRSKSDSSTG